MEGAARRLEQQAQLPAVGFRDPRAMDSRARFGRRGPMCRSRQPHEGRRRPSRTAGDAHPSSLRRSPPDHPRGAAHAQWCPPGCSGWRCRRGSGTRSILGGRSCEHALLRDVELVMEPARSSEVPPAIPASNTRTHRSSDVQLELGLSILKAPAARKQHFAFRCCRGSL